MADIEAGNRAGNREPLDVLDAGAGEDEIDGPLGENETRGGLVVHAARPGVGDMAEIGDMRNGNGFIGEKRGHDKPLVNSFGSRALPRSKRPRATREI